MLEVVSRRVDGARSADDAIVVEAGITELSSEWRRYFRQLIEHQPRFPGPQRFLRDDVTKAMQRLVNPNGSVLEVGVGAGELLAALPNSVRHGIDILPEAVAAAKQRDPTLRVERANAQECRLSENYDAIICDRLCHSVSDIQKLLQNLAEHLAPEGRIFLTVFNFLWSAPIAVGTRLGFTEASPPQNWLSASDFENLFELADLRAVHYEDRILAPIGLPGFVGDVVNRYLARMPGFNNFSVYRIYSLRHRIVRRPPPKVSVVVPARNEAGNIQSAVDRTPVMGKGTELVFVEGGSTDDTRERIEQVIRDYTGPLELKFYTQHGKGKGDAVRDGFAHASGDLLMILDADLTVTPEDLPKFYEVMASGVTDYVHGTRLVYPMEDDAMRFLNKLGNSFFARTFSFLVDQPITDSLCGTKVLWKDDYERIAEGRSYFGDFDPFGDFDLIFGACRQHLRIMEVPIRYRSRTYGTTNISRFRHGLLLLRMCLFAARKMKFI